VIYQGNVVSWLDGEVIISTEKLSDNTIPGLSGAPVIDSAGRLIGLMSQKAGKNERLAGIGYAREILQGADAAQ
jgi:S1-C subfamily serine protease